MRKLYSFIAAIMLVSLSCMAKDDSSLFAKAQALAAPLPELSEAGAALPVADGIISAPLRHVAAATNAANAPVLHGFMSHNSTWNKNVSNYGIYSFPAAADLTFDKEWATHNISSGAWADGMLCGYYVLNYGSVIIQYYAYDGDTGKAVVSKQFNSNNTTSVYSYYALGLAYNYKNATLYGEFMTADGQKIAFSRVDPVTGVPTQVTSVEGDIIYLTMAFDADGRLFAIGDNGVLYNIDLNKGTTKAIGNTGLQPQYYQSATIDQATGKMYWAYMGKDLSSGLYEVNLSTGKATLVSDYAGATVEITGLYSAHKPMGGVPAPIEDLDVTFPTSTDLNGTISFTAPSKCADGSAADSGDLFVNLYIDHVEATDAPQTVAPGAKYTISRVFTEGAHKVEVLLSNARGYSDRARKPFYAGADAPGAVENLAFSLDGRNASLRWDAPSKGAEGGWYDRSALTYTVTRQPDNVKVAEGVTLTTLTDMIPDRMGNYFYQVTTSTSRPGVTAESNRILYGTAFDIPYKETFDTDAPLDLYAFDDVNGDGYFWKWKNGAMVDVKGDAETANDWMFTPPLRLSDKWIYKLSFKANSVNEYYTESFNTGIGTKPTAEGMKLLDYFTVTSGKASTFESIVRVDADGIYRMGIQHASNGMFSDLTVDDVEVIAYVSTAAPAPVEKLFIANDASNSLKGTMSFTTPLKAINGAALTGISKIEVYRDKALIKTINAAATAQDFSFPVDVPQGLHKFSVVCYNEAGRGYDAEISGFGGVDIPKPVTGLRYIWDPENNAKVTLLWDGVEETGEYGHPINPSDVTYNIAQPMFGSMIEMTTGLTECRHEVTVTATEQTLAQRNVIAVTSGGKSKAQPVYFNVGPSYPCVAKESFAKGATKHTTWSITNLAGKAQWIMSNSTGTLAAQDNDNGLAMCITGTPSSKGRLVTPALDFSGADNYYLHMWVYHSTSEDPATTVSVEFTTDACNYTPLGSPIAINDSSNGWKEHHIALSPIARSKRVMLGIVGNLATANSFTAIDNLAIDTEAGIEGIEADAPAAGETRIYNLQGIRLDRADAPGIYIINGRKTVIR